MITITNNAKSKLINLIEKKGKSAFLYLKGGGCNGFSYKLMILWDLDLIFKMKI